MLEILQKRGKIAPKEQFLPLSTIFYYLMLDFYVKTGIRFSLRDKRLFEITEVEITRVDCGLIEKIAHQTRILIFWSNKSRKRYASTNLIFCENRRLCFSSIVEYINM